MWLGAERRWEKKMEEKVWSGDKIKEQILTI